MKSTLPRTSSCFPAAGTMGSSSFLLEISGPGNLRAQPHDFVALGTFDLNLAWMQICLALTKLRL